VHLRQSKRGSPVHPPDADGVRDDAAGVTIRKIVEPELGKIDHDAFTGRVRKHEAGRKEDLRALTRQPGIDAGVSPNQLLEPQIVPARDRDESILILRHQHLHLAYHMAVRRQRQLCGERGRRCTRTDQDKTNLRKDLCHRPSNYTPCVSEEMGRR